MISFTVSGQHMVKTTDSFHSEYNSLCIAINHCWFSSNCLGKLSWNEYVTKSKFEVKKHIKHISYEFEKNSTLCNNYNKPNITKYYLL